MNLFIQIPCLNEAETLPVVLKELPRQLEGFAKVEWLVIDDGSVDKTADVAMEHGVDHVVKHTKNQGLAKGFITGLDACLKLGADVIVNIDADNQYNAKDIPALVKPILSGEADLVVGARPIDSIEHLIDAGVDSIVFVIPTDDENQHIERIAIDILPHFSME